MGDDGAVRVALRSTFSAVCVGMGFSVDWRAYGVFSVAGRSTSGCVCGGVPDPVMWCISSSPIAAQGRT